MESKQNTTTQSLTTQGITIPYCLLIVLSVAGIGVTLYLTNHYMQVNFPQGIINPSACDINSYFNCDASTLSPLSNIFGIPIAAFGLLFFLNLFMSCLFPYAPWERANHALAWLNVLGCVTLFIYTIFFLKTACPFCMGHWLISALIALLMWKKALPLALPDGRVILIYVGFTTIVIGGYAWSVQNKHQSSKRLASALMRQFQRKPTLKEPQSPHKVYQKTSTFQDAPLRISKFSDFQCLSCKNFADIVPKLTKRYGNKISIQYLFYPLDQNCNANIKKPFHPLACQAAFLAHCSGEQFISIHDEIFERQYKLTQKWIDEKAKELGITECLKSSDTLKTIQNHITIGDSLEVKSTPTLIINGKKITGNLKLQQFYLLFDEILKRK